MGIVERRLREKERRIKEIVTAARELFLSKGYLNTTMLDIAELAELSRRTIYSYFKSKEEISFKLIIDSFSMILRELTEAVGSCETGLEQLSEMKNRYMRFYREDFDQFFFTLYFDYKLTLESISESESEECIGIINKISALFVSVLETGIKDGSLHVKGDLKTVAFTFMTIIHSTMQKVAGRKDLFDKILDYREMDLIENMFEILFASLKNTQTK